jgi:hypothetical protein
VRRLLVGEGAALVLLGAAAGLLGARNYADGMLNLLAVQWPGGQLRHFLTLHTTPTSFAIGYGLAVFVSLLTFLWALRGLGKLSPRQLLMGETLSAPTGDRPAGKVSFWLAVSSLGFGLTSLGSAFFLPGGEAQAGAFFTGGFLLLVAFLAIVWRRLHAAARPGDPRPSLTRLGWRNAGRNPVRSLLTAGLLAAASFLVVAVQAFHKEPGHDFFDEHAGSGGYRLIAETEVPIFQNLGDPKVLEEMNVPAPVAKKVQEVEALRVEPGDDASCLNLYKPQKPRVLGVPDSLIQKGRFAFAKSLAKTDEENANPWLLLSKDSNDGTVPAIVDANSAEWILKVGLGDTMETKDTAGKTVKLRIVGLLHESMFQSEVLVSEASFLKMFPGQEGFRFFLIATDAADAGSVQSAMSAALALQGGRVSPTLDRLAAYLAVENTYLSTFQALGGLGLLLGALGLAIVLVRGVWERRAELALLRALGFRGGQLAVMVLAENAFLLLLGLGTGVIAALLAVAPSLIGSGASVLWGQLAGLLGLVVIVGLAAGSLAVVGSLRTPVLTALRRE